MILTEFQEFMLKERWKVINKFQKMYKTSEAKEEALRSMEDKDIDFLIYCSNNIHACMFYSRFFKQRRIIEVE